MAHDMHPVEQPVHHQGQRQDRQGGGDRQPPGQSMESQRQDVNEACGKEESPRQDRARGGGGHAAGVF